MKSGIYDCITSWDDLAAIKTLGILNTVIVQWIDSTTQALRTTQLRMSDKDTNVSEGRQRPVDFSPRNQKVWFEC